MSNENINNYRKMGIWALRPSRVVPRPHYEKKSINYCSGSPSQARSIELELVSLGRSVIIAVDTLPAGKGL
jgi:hypothetical protein